MIIDVNDIIQKIVDDDVCDDWEGGNEMGIGYDIVGLSFDEWYDDALRDFLDYFVEDYQEDYDMYPPSWVLDAINYERNNFGTITLYDIGDDYDRFHKYINYIILLQKIQEDEDDEVIIAFKQDMKYVYLSILENEEEEQEEQEQEESEEEEEEEEEQEEEEEEQPDREI
tara:strand:+ start:1152 stop:1661 length:510 start_codon:yes stop_codon:yes gene_type:complete